MSGLITELKYEHSKITDTLSKVITLGINSEEGRDLLYTSKTYLLEHLKKEDIKLYPALREAAKNNIGLKHIVDLYANDMNAISKIALEFFEKYETGGDSVEFGKDYKNLFVVLTERIMKEETMLYKKYDEIFHV